MANGMGSIFVGHSGLKASQDSIHNVANNLANVNTPGYVRQQVVFRDARYSNLAYSKNNYKKLVGQGTSIGEIVHARDIFLDKAFRRENGRQSYYAATFEAIDEVQNYFQELEGTAFQQILDDDEASLWQAFEEFAKDPSDMANQNLVIQKASLFASRSLAVFKGLMNYQKNINIQISDDIDKVNQYIEQIYNLNIQIQSTEAGGRETAMNERDARDYALDQLSKFGNVTYEERVNGSVSVKFEGVLIADDMFYYKMGKKTDPMTGFITPYWPHLSNEEGGRYEEVFDFTREICTEFNTDIGELKALLQARGTTVSNFNDILNVNADHYDATTGLSIMQNTQAEFDNLVHGIATQINDLLAPNITMDELLVQNEDGSYSVFKNVKVLDEENCCVGADGKKPPQELFTRSGCERYRTVTAYDKETGTWRDYYMYNEEDVNDSIEITMNNGKTYHVFNNRKEPKSTTVANVTPDKDQAGNDLLDQAGFMAVKLDANGKLVLNELGERPYTPWDKPGNSKYTNDMVDGSWVLNESYYYDKSKQYTALEIEINYDLLTNITNLPHQHENMSIAYDMANNLADLWDKATLFINPRYTQSQYTYSDYYKEMIGEIAIIGSLYETTSDKLEATVEAVENQRNEVIGVSSDEELTRMIKYQNAYNASSRYIQTVSDMIEMLVTML